MSRMPTALPWRRSSYSESGNCVEVALLADGNLVIRDSKDRTVLVLRFAPGKWGTFLCRVKGGEFDCL